MAYQHPGKSLQNFLYPNDDFFMSGSAFPLQRGALLLLLLVLGTVSHAQWHQYCFRDTFPVPAGVPAVLKVLANDDLNPASSAPNFTANPVTVDYPFPFGSLQSEQGGTLIILNDDSIQLLNAIKLQLIRSNETSPRDFIVKNYSIKLMNEKYETLISNDIFLSEVA